MNRLLSYFVQRQAGRTLRYLAAVLLSGSALLGQSSASSRGREYDRQLYSHPFPDWNIVDEPPPEPEPPHAGSNIVTFQELRHKIPNKAIQEADKAQRALAKKRLDEVIIHYKRAISIDPEFVAARNNLAALYLNIQRPDDAIAHLKEAAKFDPHQPVIFSNLAVCYAAINEFDAAERAARTSVHLDRTQIPATFLLGFALVKQRKFTEEALQSLDRVHDEYPIAHLLAASVLEAKGDLERAKSEVRTYLTTRAQEHRGMATRWLVDLSKRDQKSFALLPQGESQP